MRRWKRAKRGNDRSKDVRRKRLTREQGDTFLRWPTICLSIQQKTDSLCGGNHGSPTCASNKFGDRWNGNVFAVGKFISPANYCGTLDTDLSRAVNFLAIR